MKEAENEAQVIQEQVDYNPKFWVNHLEYNIDDLMNDLWIKLGRLVWYLKWISDNWCDFAEYTCVEKKSEFYS